MRFVTCKNKWCLGYDGVCQWWFKGYGWAEGKWREYAWEERRERREERGESEERVEEWEEEEWEEEKEEELGTVGKVR
jgi:hypothetical protein